MSVMGYDYGWQPYSHQGCQPTPDCLTIDLDGITFEGRAPSAGYGYGLTGWSGWLDGADAVGGPVQYETADGGYRSPVYMRRRVISLEGLIIGRDKAEMWQLADALSKICTRERWAPMVVAEDALGLERQMDVCRLRRPQITFREDRRTAVFTIELESDGFPKLDSTLSSVDITSGSTVDCTNIGDYPANLVAYAYGPLTNFSLAAVDGSWSWWYTGTVASGSALKIDFAQRTVINTATGYHYRRNAGGKWPQIQPGSQKVRMSATGAGKITLQWRSAWA